MNSIFIFLKPKSRRIVEKGEYRHGVARVKCEDGLYNFVNEDGHFIFKKGFNKAEEFFDECTIAGDNLISINGKIHRYWKVERLKNANGLFVAYKHSEFSEDRCALVNSKGKEITPFDYTFFYVDKKGFISAGYTKEREQSMGQRMRRDLWRCKLDLYGKEITPRESVNMKKVNDTLRTCFIYNEGVECYCLYDFKSNVIVAKNVDYVPETNQYKIITRRFDDDPYSDNPHYQYGISNLNMTPIIQPQFDSIIPSSEPNLKNADLKKELGPYAKTRYYIVKNDKLYGLYTTEGTCILEPRYCDIQSKSGTCFFADSGKAICVYSEKDRAIRVLVNHSYRVAKGSLKMIIYNKKYELFESRECGIFFTTFMNPVTGKIGLVDDILRVLLNPVFDSIDYNLFDHSINATRGNITEHHILERLIEERNNSFEYLDLSLFPIEDYEGEYSNVKALSQKPKSILFFDTETNGLPKNYYAPSEEIENWPRLLQLSWVVTDDNANIQKRQCFYIKPEGFELKTGLQNPHAFSEELLKRKGVSVEEALLEFSKDVESADLLVGHNVRFDRCIIQSELKRLSQADFFADKPMFCTMIAGKPLCAIVNKYGFKYPTLQELYRHLFNKEFEGAHNASNDVNATIDCFFALNRLYPISDIFQADERIR